MENLNFKKQVSIHYDNWFNTVQIFVTYRITASSRNDFREIIKLSKGEIDPITIDGIKYNFEYLVTQKIRENEDGTMFEVTFVNQ
jgi:hypothetical protein